MSNETETTHVELDTIRERLSQLEESQRVEGENIQAALADIEKAKANRIARAGRIAELRLLLDPPAEPKE